MQNCRRVFVLLLGLALIGWLGQPLPAQAEMYWMDEEADGSLRPSFVGAELENGDTGTVIPWDTFIDLATSNPGDWWMPIILYNPSGHPVGGVQFGLWLGDVDNAIITDVVIDPALDALGFELKHNAIDGGPGSFDGELGVVIFAPPQSPAPEILPDPALEQEFGVSLTIVGQIWFEPRDGFVPAVFPLGTQSQVDAFDVLISDTNGDQVGDHGVYGYIMFGIRGDINLDSEIDIRDVVMLVNIILDHDPAQGWDARDVMTRIEDMNGDGTPNVTDVVAQVNHILGLDLDDDSTGILDKPVPSGPITVDLGAAALQADGRLAIPVFLETSGLIAGAQATFTFDPTVLSVGTPELVGNASDMLINSTVSDGKLRVIVVSLVADRGLSTGFTPMMLIPVTLLDDSEVALTLTDITLADRLAQVVTVQLGEATQSFTKDAAAPISFALTGNAPNPFNPSTTVSYDVPQQAHITLTVYNLLGQEVVRLVDQVQTPGRYQVVWNARNARGLSVSSGVYLYRMISSTGYTSTKRMTLLK